MARIDALNRRVEATIRQKRNGGRSETAGIDVDRRGAARAELMSAAASPGGTWRTLGFERGLSFLAAEAAAAFLRGGPRRARLSGLLSAPAAPAASHRCDEIDSRC